jgi:hypothetical protein
MILSLKIHTTCKAGTRPLLSIAWGFAIPLSHNGKPEACTAPDPQAKAAAARIERGTDPA